VDEIGTREARARLPELLAAAAEGAGVRITRHGQAVAVLLPPQAAALWERHEHRRIEADRQRAEREQAAAATELLEEQLVGAAARLTLYERTGLLRDWTEGAWLQDLDEEFVTRTQVRQLLGEHQQYLTDEVNDIWFDEGRPAVHTKRFRDSISQQRARQELLETYQVAVVDPDGTVLGRIDHEGTVVFAGFDETS
jgi:prevent-host-death family protein